MQSGEGVRHFLLTLRGVASCGEQRLAQKLFFQSPVALQCWPGELSLLVQAATIPRRVNRLEVFHGDRSYDLASCLQEGFRMGSTNSFY